MHLLSPRSLVWWLAAALGTALPAQSLLKDIDLSSPAPGKGARPGNFARAGTTTFFAADDPIAGRELFATDGTAANTRLVKDTVPGLGSQQIGEPVALGNLLLFRALDVRIGNDRLWRTDGTAAGTYVLSSTAEGPTGMVPFGGGVVFVANTAATGLELWITDGTVAGTSLLIDLWPGPVSGVDLNLVPQQAWPRVNGSELLFVGNDGVTGAELWRTDGTVPGTQLVVDLNSGGDANIQAIGSIGAQVVFAADDGSSGIELWALGTSGATLLADINNGGSSYPNALTESGGLLYFVADDGQTGSEVWVTDGVASTQQLADLYPGQTSSFPGAPQLVASGPGIVFLADNGVTGIEPWFAVGTAAPTLIGDLWPGSVGSAIELVADSSGTVYLAANDGVAGLELWMIAGFIPVLLSDIQSGAGSSGPSGLRTFGTELWFSADDGVHGEQPWVLDQGGVRMVRDLGTGITVGSSSEPRFVGRTEQTALFVANDPVGGSELWRSDGTAAGTERVKDIAVGSASSNPNSFAIAGGIAYFAATTAGGDTELWRSDGTAAGTYRVADLWPGSNSSYPTNLVPFGNGIAFSAIHPTAGPELWFSDGTAAGTHLVDLIPGPSGGVGSNLVAAGALLFGVATDPLSGGQDLFASDGTSAGTAIVPLPGGAGTGFPELHAALGARIVFTAVDATSGREVWISDGTVGGTLQLADANPGLANGFPGGLGGGGSPSFVPFGNRVFYACDNGSQGTELWVTDGTPAGTSLFLDIAPGPNGSRPSSFAVAADRLYFVADDGVHGFELWVSDGTVGGTQMVRDVQVGPGHGVPYDSVLTVGADRVVVFSADTAANGLEPWRSNGTAAGTVQLADLTPGAASSSMTSYLRAGNRVYFANFQPSTGNEPWSLPVSATGAAIADPFGVPCPGLLPAQAQALGTPRVGNGSFAFGLAGSAPGSLALLVLGDARGTLPLGLCSLYPAGNVGTASAVVSSAGTASVPFPLPSTASLVGFQLTSQWVVVTPGGPLLGFLLPSAGLYVVLGS